MLNKSLELDHTFFHALLDLVFDIELISKRRILSFKLSLLLLYYVSEGSWRCLHGRLSPIHILTLPCHLAIVGSLIVSLGELVPGFHLPFFELERLA